MSAIDVRLHFAHEAFEPAISTKQKPSLLSFLDFGDTEVTFAYPEAQRVIDQLSSTDMYDIAGLHDTGITATGGNPLFYDGPANAFFKLKARGGVSEAQVCQAFETALKRVAGDRYALDVAQAPHAQTERPSIVCKLS